MKTLFTKSIIIQLQPSSLLLGLLLAVATVSSLVLLMLPVAITIKLVIFGLIVLSSAYYIARDAVLVLPWSWQTIEVDSRGVLTLINKRQQRFKPQLASTTFVHEGYVILNLKSQGVKLALPPVLIFSNAHNLDALRRLRVWLRLYENKRGRQAYPQAAQLTTTGD